MEKKYQWYRVASGREEINWGADGLAELEAGAKKVCMARHGEQLFACAARCPHAGGIMANGYIDPMGNIVCPLHRYKFSLSKGRNVTGEGYYLKTFPVEEREDGIYVGIEEQNFFNWLK